MMRLNAPISAILALAVLYFFPANTLASPAHRVAHNPTAPSTHRKAAKPATSRKSTAGKTTRVHAQPSTAHHNTRRNVSSSAPAKSTQPELTASTQAQKATSDDFIKAAESPSVVPAPVAIHGTSRPDEPSETQTRSRVSKHVSGSKPATAVGAARSREPRPQLQSLEETAATPVILPTLYNKRGRLIVPPPLKGSHEILVRQNQVADRDGLDRIQNDEDLIAMRNKHLLVALPASNALEIDERLPGNRRYARPWTAQFLVILARAHYAHFHTPLQVNSAVRTVEFQQHLVHINGNAAPAEGDTASPHLTGQAVDIAKHGLSLTEIAWLRGYLLPLVQEGKVDVEEEFQQACFISVYRKYLPSDVAPNRPGASHHSETTALAAAMR